MAHEPHAGAWRRTGAILAIATGFAASLLFTAQANAQPEQVSPAPETATADAPPALLTPEVFYRLLVADVALQRGQAAIAARAYYEVARETRNVVFARRATEIAVATRQGASPAAPRGSGSELDPAADRPKEIVARLEKEGATDAALESLVEAPDLQSHLQRLLARAAAQGPAAIGDAFLQLNRLLAQGSDRRAALTLAQALAAPYDSVPEAHLVVAFAAYAVGPSDMSAAALAMKEVRPRPRPRSGVRARGPAAQPSS